MGKHKRERSRSREKKKKKKRSRSSSSESRIHKKSHKKFKKKCKKPKDNNSLPSIDEIISSKMKEKQTGREDPSVNNVNEQMPKKSLAPMTKEQYDEKQSVVRKVFDEDTGRMRLVKGDGEIIEEIVSASRQKEINKAATLGDGNSFQANISSILHK